MRSANRSMAVASLAAMTGLLAACGSPTGTPPSKRTIGQSTSGASPAVAATESNPPGDIPDSQAYVTFTVPGGDVLVKVPEGWASSRSGIASAFTDKLNRIEMATSTAGVAPTVSSVTATDLGKLQSSVPKFADGKVTGDHRAGQPVILIRYSGDSPQDPVTGKVVRDAFEHYVYYHNGQRLDLTLSGPTNADNVDPWRTVSDSVRWQR
jgi:hypothetical protein